MTIQSNPYLSIVMGIGGVVSKDLIERLHNSANNTIALAERVNLNMELIIVEWNMNSVMINYPFILPKTDIPIRIIRTEGAHDRVPNPYGFQYFEWYPKNIGIRRANGQFVLSTNPDDIFSSELFEYFSQQELHRYNFYRVNRYDYRNDEVYAICRNDGVYWPGDAMPKPDNRIHYCASGDFTLMSKWDWCQMHGNPETSYNHTVDGQTLYLASRAGMRQTILPYPIYHPDHKRTLNHAFMPNWYDSRPHGIMNETWGMENEVFPETRVIGRGQAKQAALPRIPKPGAPKWRTWPDPKPENVVLIKILDNRLKQKNGEFVYLDRLLADRWIKSGHAELYLTTNPF